MARLITLANQKSGAGKATRTPAHTASEERVLPQPRFPVHNVRLRAVSRRQGGRGSPCFDAVHNLLSATKDGDTTGSRLLHLLDISGCWRAREMSESRSSGFTPDRRPSARRPAVSRLGLHASEDRGVAHDGRPTCPPARPPYIRRVRPYGHRRTRVHQLAAHSRLGLDAWSTWSTGRFRSWCQAQRRHCSTSPRSPTVARTTGHVS